MKLKKYSKYKDSGIDWIGEIPEDWEVDKMKFLLDVPVTDGPHETPEFIDEGIPFLSVDSIQKGEIIFDNCRKISISDYKKYKLKCNPQKNDLFMGKAASIGKIARVKIDFPFSIWSPLALLRVSRKMTPFFFEYALKSDYIQDQIEILSTSNTQKNISMGDIPRIILVTPPIQSQKNISSFLDLKTSQIEKLIEKDKNLIEFLKEKRVSLINKAVTKGLDDSVEMKDSGVEWIGEIPEGWKVKRLFGVCRIVRGNSAFKKDELLEKGKYIALQYGKTYNVDEVNEQFQFYVNNEFYKSSQVVNYGDTILVSTSETVEDLGHTVFYKRKDTGLIGGEQILLKPNTNTIYNKYLFYSSRIFTKRLVQFATGVKVFRFNINDLNTTYLGVPAIEEQQKIVEFLDKKTLKIDNHIKKVEERIEFYEEYKKSVIYNVVTGKVEV